MKPLILTATLLGTASTLAIAGDDHSAHALDQPGAILSPADPAKTASFDILAAHAHRDGQRVTFHMTTAGRAGADCGHVEGHALPVCGHVEGHALPVAMGSA